MLQGKVGWLHIFDYFKRVLTCQGWLAYILATDIHETQLRSFGRVETVVVVEVALLVGAWDGASVVNLSIPSSALPTLAVSGD